MTVSKRGKQPVKAVLRREDCKIVRAIFVSTHRIFKDKRRKRLVPQGWGCRGCAQETRDKIKHGSPLKVLLMPEKWGANLLAIGNFG